MLIHFFVGVSDLEVKRLQRVQNSLARVVLCVPLRTCSSVLLNQLHWLPVEFRIRFKLACLTYKAISTSKATYLHALLTPPHQAHVLVVCDHQAHVYYLNHDTEQLWALVHSISLPPENALNRLPLSLRSSNSSPSFKKRLKTHYFFLALKELEN